MSLTNKVAIVMDLRAQSTRRFQFSVSKRLVTGSPSRSLIETNFLVLLEKWSRITVTSQRISQRSGHF